MPDSFAIKPTIEGEYVTLRPFQQSDIPAVAAAIADPEVGRLTGSVSSSDEGAAAKPDLETLRAWYGSRNEQTDRLDLAVVDRDTGLCVGEVVLNDHDVASQSCNFRTLIGPDGRDRGLGTEAARLIVDYGFDVLGLHRIALEVYAFNPRARRVYDKIGFVVEGTLRDALLYDGERIDATVMSILSTDPREAPTARIVAHHRS